MSNIIRQSIRLQCDAHRAFKMSTANNLVAPWLCPMAEIEPEVGGKYELYWDVANKNVDSTIGCKVTAFEPDQLLSFDWKGPRQFKHFMNYADRLTHVVVVFIPSGAALRPRTHVHLIHSGSRDCPEWEEARLWFERVWTSAFAQVKEQIDGEEATAPSLERKPRIRVALRTG
jgi:uncharacterized protein YndB with AHSA1/START domain